MKMPDITSVLVAASLGVFLLYVWNSTYGAGCQDPSTGASVNPLACSVLPGAVIGAGVQIGVRLLGVS